MLQHPTAVSSSSSSSDAVPLFRVKLLAFEREGGLEIPLFLRKEDALDSYKRCVSYPNLFLEYSGCFDLVVGFLDYLQSCTVYSSCIHHWHYRCFENWNLIRPKKWVSDMPFNWKHMLFRVSGWSEFIVIIRFNRRSFRSSNSRRAALVLVMAVTTIMLLVIAVLSNVFEVPSTWSSQLVNDIRLRT